MQTVHRPPLPRRGRSPGRLGTSPARSRLSPPRAVTMRVLDLDGQRGSFRHWGRCQKVGLLRVRATLIEAASPAAVAFEAALSAPIGPRFGLPTAIQCVPAPSNQGAQNRRRVGRSSRSGIPPIWTNRRSPSGALSPLRCRRELIPILPGQGLCQASAQSFGERQQQGPEANGVMA
jgi:hypothetical protein